MDTKVTKKRLSEMLQYDWIKIICVIVISVVLWELLFTFGAVKTTPGQNFTVFYYPTINTEGSVDCKDFLRDADFSYDIFERNVETLDQDYFYDIMEARSAIHTGDIMVAENVDIESATPSQKGDERYNQNVMYWLTDLYGFYSYEDLALDARAYLDSFKRDGEFDLELIEKNFRARMKKDNRFRSEKNIQKGLVLEQERLLFLEEEVKAFEWLVFAHADSGLFAKYTKFQYAYHYAAEEDKEDYREAYESQTEKSYGLNAEFLDANRRNDQKSISNLFSMPQTEEGALLSQDIVVMVFNYKDVQPDLQFETIVFINDLVETYSDLFSGYQA